MATPMVSIGLPVYNGEQFVAGAIRSALDQRLDDRYGGLELIVADNGSTDGTEEICREAARADPRVRYLRSPDNQGASWNFSRVVPEARGKYFRWAAHDDLCSPELLQRQVEVLEADPSVVLVYPWMRRIDENGKPVGPVMTLPRATAATAGARTRNILLRRGHSTPAPFGLTRTEQLATTSLLQAFKGADRVLLFELAMLGRFQEIPEVLFWNRLHEGRSVNLPVAKRLSWWDGGADGRAFWPWWRMAREYTKAAMRAPIPAADRAAVLANIPLWCARNASPLGREAVAFTRRRLTPATP